jgi:flagellar hook protein FlgE
MNVIGNNIANVNTVGFKQSRTMFSDMLSANVGNNSQVGKGVQTQVIQNIFTQGSAQGTENITDLSIQGNSFFALGKPGGNAQVTAQNTAYLSRAGAFKVDSSLTLVNADGYQVLDTDGRPITFKDSGSAPTTDFSKIVSIDTKGLITYLATDGVTQNYYDTSGNAGKSVSAANAATVQRLAVVTASDPSALSKAGGSLYQAGTNAGVPSGAFALASNQPNGTSEKVLTNSLEQSNVDMANEFVKMITTQRAYSANSKTITTTDQMTQEVLGLIR